MKIYLLCVEFLFYFHIQQTLIFVWKSINKNKANMIGTKIFCRIIDLNDIKKVLCRFIHVTLSKLCCPIFHSRVTIKIEFLLRCEVVDGSYSTQFFNFCL